MSAERAMRGPLLTCGKMIPAPKMIRPQCARHGLVLAGWKVPAGADDGNCSEPQRGTPRGSGKKRLANLRPQEHELAVRPGAGGELAGNNKAQMSSETHQVEPGGTKGKSQSLPGESPVVRATGKSAEAIVVWIAGESRTERRAEGARNRAREVG